MIRRFLRRRRTGKGFTLVETLVALGVAALALNGFYSALSTGALLNDRSNEQAEKVLVATSIMDRVGVDIAMQPGFSDNGTSGAYNWDRVVSAASASDMQLGAVLPGELVFVYVSVTEPGSSADPVTLRSIRYAETPL